MYDLIVWKTCLVLRSLCNAFISFIAMFTARIWCWDEDGQVLHEPLSSFGMAAGSISEDVFVVRAMQEPCLLKMK